MSQSDLDTITTVASSYILPSEADSSVAPAADVNDDRPLAVRIEDKNWKCRLSAYDDLKNLILKYKDEAKDGCGADSMSTFTEYTGKINKFCADSNATALDAALDLAIVFIENVPSYNIIKDHVDSICSVVLDKSFSSRPSTQLKGKMIFIKIMEVEDPHAPTKVLLSKLSEKRPKIPPVCLELIMEGIASFGIKSFPVKEILKEIPAVLNGSNGPARETAMLLLLDISKWIGKAPLNSIIDNLRDVQKLQFEKSFSEIDMTTIALRPTIYLRKDKHLALVTSSAPIASSGNTADSTNIVSTKEAVFLGDTMKIDAREFIDEIDIEKKIKGSDYSTLINEEKWSEQLKATQLIIDMLGQTPRVKPGPATLDALKPVISKIKSLLSSNTTHISLQLNALKIVTLLADGLRNDFNILIRPHIELIILKCKEKKLLSDVTLCLTNLLKYCCNSFDSMSEYMTEEMKNKKTPAHGRVLLMDFLSSSLSNIGEKFSGNNLKALIEPLRQCIDDSDPTVRSACVLTLAHVYALVTKKGKVANDALKLILAIENVNPKIFKKIKDGPCACTPATSASTSNTAKSTASLSSTNATGNPSSAYGKAAGPLKASSTTSSASSLSKPTTGVGASKSSKPSSAIVASNKPSSAFGEKKTSSIISEETVEELNVNADDAKAELGGLSIENWDSGFQELICSTKWQEKVEALTTLTTKITETKSGGKYSKSLVSFISHHTGKFKISNINILKSVIQLFCAAAQAAKAAACEDEQNDATGVKFSKAAAWELIKNFGDKLSDKKTKDPVCELLTALNECISPAFVVRRMVDGVLREKCVAPLAHQFFLEWLKVSIKDFGASVFPLKFIIDFLVTVELENKNAQVRTCAIEVIGGIYNQIGQKIYVDMKTDDMKPALKSVIDAEIAKVGFDPTALNTTVKKAVGDADGAAAEGVDLMSSKIDLLTFLEKNINSELNLIEGKTSWQNRKAAMESVIAACERAGHSIEGSKGVVEIVKSLKARMNDTQANLKPIAVIAIGHVLCSLDVDVACKYLKGIGASLLGGLADNKKPMRSATTDALQMIVTLSKVAMPAAVADSALLAVLVSPISEFIATNTIGREELLMWLNTHLSCIKVDCNEIASPLILALQDKTAVVRANAEKALLHLVGKSLIAKKTVERIASDLPPAQRRALQGSIGKIMEVTISKKDTNSDGGTGAVTAGATTLSTAPSAVTAATSSDDVSQSSTHALLQTLRNLNEEMCSGSQPMDNYSILPIAMKSLVHSATKVSPEVANPHLMPPPAPAASSSSETSPISSTMGASSNNKSTPGSLKALRGGGTPEASTPKLFLSPASSPGAESSRGNEEDALHQLNQAIHEVEEIYLDIILKVDHLLQYDGNALTPSKRSYETIHSDAKTNMKILNSILNGEWVFNALEESTVVDIEEENDILYKYTQNIIRLLVQCIERGFPKGSKELYDMSIIKLAMANLYAMIKRGDVLARFGERCLYDVFRMCLTKLVDSRIVSTPEDGSNRYLEIGNALNMIVLKLANDTAPSAVLTALIKVLLSLRLGMGSETAEDGLSACIEPIAKTIRQVLSKLSIDNSSSEMSMSSLQSLLETIHSSYAAYPPSSATTPHDDVLLCTLKTVLKVLTKKVGIGKIVSAIDSSSMTISHESFLFQTVLRLSNSSGVNKELQVEVDSIIDLIMTAKDKHLHIQELHAIRKVNPHINLDNYVSKALSIFQKSIQNELTKLSDEEKESVQVEDAAAVVGNGGSNDENKKPTSSILGLTNVKDS